MRLFILFVAVSLAVGAFFAALTLSTASPSDSGGRALPTRTQFYERCMKDIREAGSVKDGPDHLGIKAMYDCVKVAETMCQVSSCKRDPLVIKLDSKKE